MFNGNCKDAISLYERAFATNVKKVIRYKDAPAEEGYEEIADSGDLILHAEIFVGDDVIYLCDSSPLNKCTFGNGMAIHINFDDINTVHDVFAVLKQGGEVGMEPTETFWSKSFAILVDEFGVNWMLSYEEGKH